ncbi:MAG: trigger factor [bacterium]|nr:trigger factor [bacterium]
MSPGEMSEIHFEPGQPLSFKVVVEVLPDVTIPPLAEIEVELRDPQASDEDVNTALDGLRESQAVLVPSDDPIDDHSVVTFDLQELDSSGLPLVGKSQKDITIDMSRQQFGEDFASRIKGLKSDGKTNYDFHRSGDPNAKPLKTQISIRNVQRKELPELDEAFVQSVNPNLGSLDDLRGDLRRYIESRAAHTARQEMFRKLADELLRRSEYAVPPRMLENYLDRMADEATHNSKHKPDEAAMAKFREEYRTSAIWTLRWYLMRNSLIKTHDLRTSDEEIEHEIAHMATLEDQLAGDFKKRLSPDQMQQIADDLQERKVLNFLENNVKITKAPVSLAEFEGRSAAPSIITE